MNYGAIRVRSSSSKLRKKDGSNRIAFETPPMWSSFLDHPLDVCKRDHGLLSAPVRVRRYGVMRPEAQIGSAALRTVADGGRMDTAVRPVLLVKVGKQTSAETVWDTGHAGTEDCRSI